MGILKKLQGFKTYIAGALMILTAIAGLLNGDTSGIIELIASDNLQNIFEGAAVMALRAGIAKK